MKEGWKYTTIGESCNINYGTRVVRSKDGGTIYDVYGGGGATFKMDTYNREDCLVVARFAMSKQCTRYVKGKFFLNDSGLTVSPKDGSNLSQTLLDKILLALNDTIYSFGRGSAQRNLNIKEFSEMKIAYPINLAEQEKFVSLLDAQFAKIDAIKANAEKQLQDAKALFQSALNDLLTPKEGWRMQKLEDIAIDMYRGSGIKRDQVTEDGIACVRYGEIYTKYNYCFETCYSHTQGDFVGSKKYFEKGDILFAITGESIEEIGKSIAYLGNERCLAGGDIVVMKHNQEPRYLSYALSTPEAIRQKGLGKTKLKVVHTNVPSLKSIIIPVPSLIEQEKIADILDALASKIQSLQSNYDQTITLCNDLKQSLLKDIFS